MFRYHRYYKTRSACHLLVSCPAYFSTLKMEVICSSETSVDFQRTTRRYIPEDSTLHNYRCENLKFYKTYEGYSTRQIAAGPRQHSNSWFQVQSRPMAILYFFSRLLRVLKWGLLFDKRRGVITTGHSPSTRGDSSGRSFANWPSAPPPPTHTHKTYKV
jgi:hypothetical protein